MSIKALSDYTQYSKYAKYNKEKKRRETWGEQVDRVFKMHEEKLGDKFDLIKTEFEFAKEMVRKKRVLGSQRALQFGGDPILSKNAKIYNCCASYVDRVEFFKECIWLLLCGTGTGFSVQNHHIDKLPLVKPRNKGKKTFVIPDSIEGWADAIGVLVQSYFDVNDSFYVYDLQSNLDSFSGYEIEFDYSVIRPEGSHISWGGKAPGPEGLRKAIDKIVKHLDGMLEEGIEKLRPIHVYDIIMHMSDAVLSGGVRRCISKGSKVLVKDKSFKNIEDIAVGDFVSTNNGWKPVKNIFDQGTQKTIKIVHQDGSLRCTENHRIAVLTDIKGGYEWKYAKDILKEDVLFFVHNENENYNITPLPTFNYEKPLHSTTCKDIIIPEMDEDIAWLLGEIHGDGYVYLTSKSGQISVAVEGTNPDKAIKIKNILERFGVYVNIRETTEEDNSYKVIVKSKQLATYFSGWLKTPKTSIKVPECIKTSTDSIKIAYVQGVLDADGSIGPRCQQIVTSVYKEFVIELQNLLYSVGIISRMKKCSVSGLKYGWKEKYSLYLINNEDREMFNEGTMTGVGYKKFVQSKCQQKSNSYPNSYIFNESVNLPKHAYKKIASNSKNIPYSTFNNLFGKTNIKPIRVVSVEFDDIEVETYDIEVEDNHNFICEGILVHNSATLCLFSPEDDEMASAKTGDWFVKNPQRGRSNNSALLLRNETTKEQFSKLMKSVKEYGEPGFIWADSTETLFNPCCEITFNSYDEEGNSGWGFCNLCEINGRKCKTEEDFLKACTAASIIGTIQATYDKFDYLSETTERIVKRDALLGVSITGMMDSPNILFDDTIQRKAAKTILEINEKISNILGINSCARSTCVKPAGSTSCILETASGIHAHHSKRYMRRVQANKLEFPAQHFSKINPNAVEDSVWSNNSADMVLTFLCEVPDGIKTKNQISAIELLENVKTTQKNWVDFGTRKNDWRFEKYPWLRHNVSNTINVKPDEWELVEKFIYENRKWFAGISLLPHSGDLDYPQAPFVNVLNEKELVRTYGEGTVFASGLVVDGLHAFNDNLWVACDCALGVGEILEVCVYPEEPEMPAKNGYTAKQWAQKLALYAANLEKYQEDKEVYDICVKKQDWVRRFKQFAERYCEGNLRKCTHMLKHVSLWKQWLDLKRVYKDIDWSEVVEDDYQIDVSSIAGAACSGGKCDNSLQI